MRTFEECLEILGCTLVDGKYIEKAGRRYKAIWSSDVLTDLKAFHGVDAEKEVTECVVGELYFQMMMERMWPETKPIDTAVRVSTLHPAAYALAKALVENIPM